MPHTMCCLFSCYQPVLFTSMAFSPSLYIGNYQYKCGCVVTSVMLIKKPILRRRFYPNTPFLLPSHRLFFLSHSGAPFTKRGIFCQASWGACVENFTERRNIRLDSTTITGLNLRQQEKSDAIVLNNRVLYSAVLFQVGLEEVR